MAINYDKIIEFMSNPEVRQIPGFDSFKVEIMALLDIHPEPFKYKPLFTKTECGSIRDAIEYVKECNESWTEGIDHEMAEAHRVVIDAARTAIRKRGK